MKRRRVAFAPWYVNILLHNRSRVSYDAVVEEALKMFFVFGVPVFGAGLYHAFFSRVRDTTIYRTGLMTTIHFLLWFSIFTAVSAGYGNGYLIAVIVLYLILVAPLISIALARFIKRNRHSDPDRYYAYHGSIAYAVIVWGLLAVPFMVLFGVRIFN